MNLLARSVEDYPASAEALGRGYYSAARASPHAFTVPAGRYQHEERCAKLAGKRQIAITFMNFRYSASGDLLGTSKIRVRVTLSQDGKRFSGMAITQLFDLTGTITATINSNVDANRIAVEVPE